MQLEKGGQQKKKNETLISDHRQLLQDFDSSSRSERTRQDDGLD